MNNPTQAQLFKKIFLLFVFRPLCQIIHHWKKRQEIQMAPNNPADLTTHNIPPAYTMYSLWNGNEEIFLQSDSGSGPNRIFIFPRSKSQDILENSKIW